MPPKSKSEPINISDQIKDLKETILNRLEGLESKLSLMQHSLEQTTQIATKALNETHVLQTKVDECVLEQKNDMERINEAVELIKIAHQKQITRLEEALDDQVNRGMRSTLVFKGIQGGETSWSDTTTLLAKTISEMDSTNTEEQIQEMIDRAHRIQPKNKQGDGKKNYPRNIVAKFCTWKDAEKVKSIVINHTKQVREVQNRVYVEQLKSKKLTERANEAKLIRKELKQENPVWKLYVEYPAKLMVKKPGDKVYTVYQRF